MTQLSRHMIALPVAVPALTYDGLGRLAKQAGMRRELYAAQLLIAAYSARVKPTGDDRELEAAVAGGTAEAAPADDTIRHLLQERDGWKKTAEDLRVQLNNLRAEKATLLATSEARLGKIEAMQRALNALAVEAEDLQIKNDQLLTEIASCARPLPPIITVTGEPNRSAKTAESLAAMATAAAAAMKGPGPVMPATPGIEIVAPVPEPYGLDRRAAEEAPRDDEAPLTKGFIKAVVGYHWANTRPDQIARILSCSEAQVRRALKLSGRRA